MHDVLGLDWTRILMRRLFDQRHGALPGLMLSLRVGTGCWAHFGVRQGSAYHPWLAATDPELAGLSPGQALLGHAMALLISSPNVQVFHHLDTPPGTPTRPPTT